MIIAYSKKPRRSRTSEIIEIEGVSFFLYNTPSITRGNCEVYMATEPYLLIKVAVNGNQEGKDWLQENIDAVKRKIVTAGSYDTITREEFMKSTRAKQRANKAYENSDNQEDSSCVTGC